jgi:hypothetical protein
MDAPIYRTDDGNFVRFEWEAAKNEVASNKEARPIYDKVLRAYITCPGQKNSEMCHEIEREFADGTKRVRPDLAQRFAKQLEAYRSQTTSPELTGTPIAQWPAIDARQVAEFRALGIHTVEALAELSDSGIQKLGIGGREISGKARAYLESAKGSAHAEHLASELAKRDQEIARLTKQVESLAALLEDRTKPKNKAA